MSGFPNSKERYGEKCPVFRPSLSEFREFKTYLDQVIEPTCRDTVGICKVIPPQEWLDEQKRDRDLVKLRGLEIPSPISQYVAGKKGVYSVDLVERKKMTVEAFRHLAETKNMMLDQVVHDEDSLEDMERKFWKGLRPTMTEPVYGADMVGSLFHPNRKNSWNLNQLDTILQVIDLPGITRSMLYFGMWKAMFALHTEDMDLFSINYLHMGQPKVWYAVSAIHKNKLERACASLFPEKALACSSFLRHKTSLVSPSRLKEFHIPFVKTYQRPGEFVITFPSSYHEGFNTGFNVAEAVNFASFRWIPFGYDAQTKICHCQAQNVHVNMDELVGHIFNSRPFPQECFWYQTEEDPEDQPDWFFQCCCGKQYCSLKSGDESEFQNEIRSFECSKCQIWAHIHCLYPEWTNTPDDDLPSELYCHRCDGPEMIS